ncbi:MAG: hypothetical protein ABI840_02655 [bacterium]
MNKIIKTIIVLFIAIVFISCSKDDVKKADTDKTKVTDTTKKTAVNNTLNTYQTVAKISKYRAEGEVKLLGNKFTKKEVPFKGPNVHDDMKQKWEKVDVYSEGNNIVRLQFYPHKGISKRTEEFYLMNGKLVFAFIQDTEKHEGKDTDEPGKEFYFDNDKLIKYVISTDEKEVNLEEEKRMYETKLPYEVKETLEIIKTAN